MLLPLKRYADFEGSSRRLEYWMFALMNTVVAVALLGRALPTLVYFDDAASPRRTWSLSCCSTTMPIG